MNSSCGGPKRILLSPLPYRALVRIEEGSTGDGLRTPVLIVGSGSAALRAAIEAARHRDVLVLTKKQRSESNSRYAQGGIAAPLSLEDSLESHLEDTLRTAWGLSEEGAVREVIREGTERVRELLDWGASFDRTAGELHFGREGGHSRARILHRGDETGAELEQTLIRVAAANPRIRFLENTFAVDFLKRDGACVGVLAFDGSRLKPILAARTIVATGGLARIFRESTNPPVATGDGIAMACRAGAELMDMEFVQFHPTTFYLAGATRELISEAVRGAGAVLCDRSGRPFMKEYHEMGDLAPRDIVSRSMLRQMMKTGETQVYLDVRGIPREKLATGFPNLVSVCQRFGLDVGKDLIPVRPSAHYTIGGIRTDERARTSLPGLSACGECAATGFHGANRLASNSLLECLVFGFRAGREAGEAGGGIPTAFDPPAGPSEAAEGLDVLDMTNSLRSLLWRDVGVEREGAQLRAALSQMAFWSRYVLARRFSSPEGWELQNSLLVGEAVATAALAREESRGVHYRRDFPETRDDWLRHLILQVT